MNIHTTKVRSIKPLLYVPGIFKGYTGGETPMSSKSTMPGHVTSAKKRSKAGCVTIRVMKEACSSVRSSFCM